MPVDLEEMFDAFRVDADALPLNSPRQVRRLGRRLRLIRYSATFAATCAVIVGIAAVVTPLRQHLAPSGAEPPGIAARLMFDANADGVNGLAVQPGRPVPGHRGPGWRRPAMGRADRRADNDLHEPRHVIQVAFSPDGTTLAASDASGAIRLWDRATDQTIRTLVADRSGPVTDIAFSPDGATLATANEDGPVRLWPTAGGQPSVIRPANLRMIQCALSPDGRYVVAGGQTVDQSGGQNTIGIWDTRTLASAQTLAAFTNMSDQCGVQPGRSDLRRRRRRWPDLAVDDGRPGAQGKTRRRYRPWRAVGPGPGVQPGWPVARERRRQTDDEAVGRGHRQPGRLFDGPSGGMSTVAFSPDGRTLAGAGYGEVHLWDVP